MKFTVVSEGISVLYFQVQDEEFHTPSKRWKYSRRR